MIEFLQRREKLGFNSVTILYPDQFSSKESPLLKNLSGGLKELCFSLQPLRGNHPAIELGYTISKIISYFRRRKLHYDYCIAADLTGWQIAFPLRRLGHVSSLFYDDQDYFPRVTKSIQGRLTSIGLEKVIAKTADGVISASETLANLRRSQGARNVLVVPNGVDPSFYKLPESNPTERLKRRTIVYAGSLDHDYGVNLLLEAFSRLNPAFRAKLVLAGSGPLARSLNAEFEDEKLDGGVRLLGIVEHKKLPELLWEATVGVAPYLIGSSAAYGVPMKIKEYLAAGLPVVASRVGEIDHFLNGDVGAVIKPEVGELVEALDRILSLTPARYASMCTAARKLVKGYSWDDLYEQYFRFILDSGN